MADDGHAVEPIGDGSGEDGSSTSDQLLSSTSVSCYTSCAQWFQCVALQDEKQSEFCNIYLGLLRRPLSQLP